jgi:hypothetical protein
VDGWSRHYTIDDFIFLIIRSELQTFFNYVWPELMQRQLKNVIKYLLYNYRLIFVISEL